jgi:hypothetical protein
VGNHRALASGHTLRADDAVNGIIGLSKTPCRGGRRIQDLQYQGGLGLTAYQFLRFSQLDL